MSQSFLELRGLSAGYGDTVVLEDINLSLNAGEAVSVIGRNGVGKTTLLATLMGHTALHGGEILLAGEPLTGLKTCQRVWRGLAYVPQERDIFPSLTVAENLAVACRQGAEPERAYALFPQLKERRRNRGDQLSGGEQQMLAVGRALLAQPSVLLLDEPSEGLAPVIVEQLLAALQTLRDQAAIALVLVEQNSRIALEFAPRCVIMNRGRIVRDGASAELAADADLLARLVGVDGSE